MTRKQLEQQNLVVDNITFKPRYDYKQIEVIENDETIFVDDYTITATAEEVYDEWQTQQNATSQPTEQDKLQAQVTYTAMMTDTLLEV